MSLLSVHVKGKVERSEVVLGLVFVSMKVEQHHSRKKMCVGVYMSFLCKFGKEGKKLLFFSSRFKGNKCDKQKNIYQSYLPYFNELYGQLLNTLFELTCIADIEHF